MRRTNQILRTFSASSFIILCAVGTSFAAETATAKLTDTNGKAVGTVTLTQTSHGVLITADVTNLSPGWHGFHVHETGSCSPDFAAAGDHFNPDGKAHGMSNPEGMHAGDMPNIHVAADGSGTAEVLNTNISLNDGAASLFDADGSAIIIHEKPDSHQADPGAGGRVACGVIQN